MTPVPRIELQRLPFKGSSGEPAFRVMVVEKERLPWGLGRFAQKRMGSLASQASLAEQFASEKGWPIVRCSCVLGLGESIISKGEPLESRWQRAKEVFRVGK